MKKLVGLTIAFFLMTTVIAGGTYAYLSDSEASTGNSLTAGTLDLKTDDVDGVTQTLYATSMAPGDTVGPSSIVLKNAGSVNGASLNLAFSYVEDDGSPNTVNETADDTAGMIEVTTLSYDGTSLLGSVSDANSNGYTDIYDLANADLSGQNGLNASASKNFQIAVKMRLETGDDYQADGVVVTMTFTLNQ